MSPLMEGSFRTAFLAQGDPKIKQKSMVNDSPGADFCQGPEPQVNSRQAQIILPISRTSSTGLTRGE
jgi:hypothetical protein